MPSEKQVIFKLKNNTPAGEIGTALKTICSIQGLFNVEAIFPAEKDRKLKMLFTASVSKGVSVDKVLKVVKDTPYVEYAEEPPVRRTFSGKR